MYLEKFKTSLLLLKENVNQVIDSNLFLTREVKLSIDSQLATANEIKNEFNRHVDACVESLDDFDTNLSTFLDNLVKNLKCADECLHHYRPGNGPQITIPIQKHFPESVLITDLLSELSSIKIRVTIESERNKLKTQAEQKVEEPKPTLSAPKYLNPIIEYKSTLKNTKIKHKIYWANKSLNPVKEPKKIQPNAPERTRLKQ